LKTISQIAKEAGCTFRNVYEVIKKNKIKPIYYDKKTIRIYARIQIELIFKVLYFEGKCNVITLESKMNEI